MGYITERNEWSPSIYQVEFETPVLGGKPEYFSGVPIGGFANIAVEQLANRTQWLLGKTTTNELAIAAAETTSSGLAFQLQEHIGSGGDAHATATQTANGFMSAADKAKIDSLAPVATSNDYRDLDYKPPIDFTIRITSFEARVGQRYYIPNSVSVTLPDPVFYGLQQGDFISMLKAPQEVVTVQAHTGGLIYTAVGDVVSSSSSIIYDVDDEIIFVYDGSDWRV